MQKRFTGIRLLLVFVAINTVMMLMLVTALTSEHPWLANVLPGQFDAGVNSSGYWVFFSLVLAVNAVSVLIAGFILVFPAMRDGSPSDEKRISRHLADRAGLSEEARDSVLGAMREEAADVHYQLLVGRAILVAALLFIVAAFGGVSLSFAGAIPDGHMFSEQGASIPNSTISLEQVERFTADQLAGAVLLDAPEIYGWRFGSLVNNKDDIWFTNFTFAFRTLAGLVVLMIFAAFLRRGPRMEKKAVPAPAEAAA